MKNITLMTTKFNSHAWVMYGIESFSGMWLEGKTGGLYSMRVCTKYKQESAYYQCQERKRSCFFVGERSAACLPPRGKLLY